MEIDQGLEGPSPQATYDELLAGPLGTDLSAPGPALPRVTTSYSSHDARYRLPHREYDRQYAQLYFFRLAKMRPEVEAAAAARWPGVPLVKVSKLPEEGEAVVVGTLYKEMALKPSILDEYTKERVLAPQLGHTRFTQPEDRVVLEDEGARVALCGAGLSPGDCVTGVVAAVRGRVLPTGELEVSDVCYAGMPPQPAPPSAPAAAPAGAAAAPYVLLVSGLGVGGAATDPLLLQLLVDYVCGALGGAEEQATAARVARVVVAGGLLQGAAALSQPTAYTSARERAGALRPLRDVDMALTELAAAAPVDVMPGAADPANYSLPQQPLHRCLFPGAAAFSTFARCTNPHAFEAGGVRFLGTSGQNVDDIARYSDIDGRVAIMERLLTWRHLVPTAPDTLAAYPYYDDDPFILEEAPHVMFAGGQPAFGTGVVRGAGGQTVRLVAVPNFATTGTAVLVNLATLAVHPLQFGGGAEQGA